MSYSGIENREFPIEYAVGLYHTAVYIGRSIEKLYDQDVIEEKSSKLLEDVSSFIENRDEIFLNAMSTSNVIGRSLGTTILLSFSIELTYKSILEKENVSFPRVHDLKKLHQQLPSKFKASVDAQYTIYQNKYSLINLEELLNRDKEIFQNVRYYFQHTFDKDEYSIELEPLSYLYKSLMKTYEKQNKGVTYIE